MPHEQLIVFVKAPRPGAVKMRLAAKIGAVAACGAYTRLVKETLENISNLNEVELRFTPDAAAEEIQPWLRPGWKSCPQGEGDLGARMARSFADHFIGGAQRVVIIGSDCPEVTDGDIREAWRGLKARDLVLGPASDGGYWLIGLRRPQPALFEGIAWGGDRVLADTLQRGKEAGLQVEILRILSDVDTEKDWRRFCRDSKLRND
jgi:rSAM/selenodomain-associated transferase 1